MALPGFIETIEDANATISAQARCAPRAVTTKLDRPKVTIPGGSFLFAVRRTAVPIPLVPIVTSLLRMPNEAVAATSRLTG
tara:strand:- start:800 stop:1042 length:243 start_codon:yes stop_codon:yes gene_type:complete